MVEKLKINTEKKKLRFYVALGSRFIAFVHKKVHPQLPSSVQL